ncbi:hypothetical protein [Azospirillum largimobile]
MSDILYAFWDFHAGTPPLDLPLFLAAAEHARRQGGHGRCHVVLCDRSTGEADGDPPWDGEAEWRLWNEVIPTLWLLPSGQCFSLCRDAGEVADLAALAGADAFPVPHGGPDPAAFHECRTGLSQARDLAGSPLPAPLRATLQARDYVRQWLERRNDGRMVVTLSPAAMAGGDWTDGWAREWAAFAARLDRDRILPVLLPAAADAHRPPGPVWETVPLYAEAAWNAELRLALYEMSDLLLVEDPFGAGLALFGAETRCAAFGDTADRLAALVPAAALAAEAVRRPFPGPCDAGTLAAAYERMAGTLALPPLRPRSP